MSSQTSWIKSSFQECNSPELCLSRLECLINETRSKGTHQNVLLGLKEVLCHMHSCRTTDNAIEFDGFLTFQEAYEVFCGHQTGYVKKEVFRDHLLHPTHGLPVNIVSLPTNPHRVIILKSDIVKIPKLLNQVTHDEDTSNQDTNALIENPLPDPEMVDLLISCMDSEWDRECAKVLFTYGRSRKELAQYKFNVNKLLSKRAAVMEAATDIAETEKTARDLVMKRIQEKLESLTREISKNKDTLQHCHTWPEIVKEDTRERIQRLEDQLNDEKEVQVTSCLHICMHHSYSKLNSKAK